MNELTLLAEFSRGIPASQVRVDWHSAPPPLENAAAAYMDERWSAYLAQARAQGRNLFDGPITRLIDVTSTEDGRAVTLRVGPGSYKAFFTTCLRDHAWFAAHAPESMVPALGNSVLLTHGGVALLGIRSQRVSAYPGRTHLIGGVLEPLGTAQFPASTEGLLAHLALELDEEAHVAAADLFPAGSWPRLMAVAHDEVLAQPEAIWQWETITPLEEIAARLDVAEHVGSVLLHRGAITEAQRQQMTPVARYATAAWSDAAFKS